MIRESRFVLIFFLLGLFLLSSHGYRAVTPAYAQDYCNSPGVVCKSGFIADNEVWTPANVYVITRSMFVRKTLTIQSGTVIKLAQNATLNIGGTNTLNVNGTATNKVIFTALEDDTVGGDTNGDGSLTVPTKDNRRLVWFVNSSKGNIAHAEVRYTGLAVSNLATVTITDAILQFNKVGLDTGNRVTVTVANSIIQNNDTAVGAVAGASVSTSNSIVQNNDVAVSAGSGASVTMASSIVRNNTIGLTASSGAKINLTNCSQITDNTQYAARNLNGFIDAPLVWWGSVTGPNVTDPNGGNYVSGKVTYGPWATSQNCSGPAPGDQTISGRVIDSDDKPISGVRLLTGSGQTASTGSDGHYTLTGLAAGEHTVTPSLSGYNFAPASRTVTVGPSSAVNVDFVGSSDVRLEVNPSELRFFATAGSPPISQSLTIDAISSGDIPWQAQESLSWLSLNRTSGSTPAVIETEVDVNGLQVGRYTGQITVTSNAAINSPLALDVTLNVGCTARRSADIMLVLDTSGSMRGQPLVDAKEAALAFLEQIDLNSNQVGLVSFNAQASLRSQLSQDSAAVRTAITSLIADGDTDIAEAVQVARTELKSSRANSARQPIIILLSDGNQTVSGNPIAQAQAAKDEGVQVITIGLGGANASTLRAMASSSSDYYYTPTSDELEAIYEQISITIGCSTLTVNPTGLEYEYTLGDPVPSQTLAVGSTGGLLNWIATENLPWLSLNTGSGQTPQTVTAQLEPNNLAVGRYQGEITFTSPEATNSPVVVEVAAEVSCSGRSAVDVALVIDVSGSMANGALDEAKTAAKAFVDTMNLNPDQVTLVAFSSSARVVQPLTQDANAIKTQIDSLTASGNTNISDAIAKARSELNSNRRNAGNQPIIVLLTDGQPTVGGSPVAQANAAKAEGVYLFTVGLRGEQGLDSNLLSNIASTPDDYYETPDASELTEIYNGIAAQVGCPSLVVSPLALSFEADTNNPTAVKPITIDNQRGSAITWTGSASHPWFRLSQASGNTPSSVNVEVDGRTLAPGTYTGTLTIISPGAINSPRTIDVTLVYQNGGGRGAITGRVTNNSGQPLNRILVRLYRQLNGRWLAVGSAHTNSQGRYSRTVSSGEYRVQFIDLRRTYRSQYYNGTSTLDQAAPVNVVANTTRDNIDAVLDRSQPPVTSQGCGQIQVDASTGQILITLSRTCRGQTEIIANISCANGAAPSNVKFQAGNSSFPMTQLSGNQYRLNLDLQSVFSGSTVPYRIDVICGSASETAVSGQVQRYDPSGMITDRRTGQPIAGATVNLYRLAGALPDEGEPTSDCRTVDTRPVVGNGVFGPWSGLPAFTPDEAHWVNPSLDLINGDREISPALNPQVTGKDGNYGWDVVKGCWYIEVAASGYETLVSPLVGVPPAVTDLNLQLEWKGPEPGDDNDENESIFLPIVVK